MAADASIMTVFGGDISPLTQSAARAGNVIKDFAGKTAKGAFGDLIGPIAKVAAAIGSVGAVMKGISGSLELGAEMQDLSARTGVAVQDLVMLRKSFRDAGVDAEKLGPAVNKMQKALAEAASGGKDASLFQGLGLDAKKLAGQDPGKAFEAIGAAIAKLPNATERAAAAMQIFGKSGGELLAVFQSPAFQNAGNISATAKLLGENAASFKEAHEALSHVGSKLQGFFVGISSEFIPALHGAIEEFEKLDLSAMGQEIGNAIGNAFTNFPDEWNKIVEYIGQSFDIIFSPEGLKVFGAELLIIASKFGDAILRSLKTPLDYIQAAIQFTTEKTLQAGGNPTLAALYEGAGFSNGDFGKTVKEVQQGNSAVSDTIASNAQNRRDLAQSMDLSSRLKGLSDQFVQAFRPVVTATAATIEANAKGREEANRKAPAAGSQAPFDASEIGKGQSQIIADSFAKVGGGGFSAFLGLGDIQRQQLAAQQQANQYLAIIAKNRGDAGWMYHAAVSP